MRHGGGFGRLILVLSFAFSVLATGAHAIDLPKKEGGLYPLEAFDGTRSLSLADFPASQYLRKSETRGAGSRGLSELLVGEISGTVTDDGAAWVLQIASMPGFDVRRLGRPLKVEMTLDAPGHVTNVSVGDLPQSQALKDTFANAFSAFQVLGSEFSIGDTYYADHAPLRAGGLKIDMAVQSVVDGIVTINGRTAFAVRFAGEGRVNDATGWLAYEKTGYRYVDTATSTILRSAEIVTTKGKSNGTSFSVSQFNEALIELPSASRI